MKGARAGAYSGRERIWEHVAAYGDGERQGSDRVPGSQKAKGGQRQGV